VLGSPRRSRLSRRHPLRAVAVRPCLQRAFDDTCLSTPRGYARKATLARVPLRDWNHAPYVIIEGRPPHMTKFSFAWNTVKRPVGYDLVRERGNPRA
jgi:hypothetical protein